jgi:hypothetical protein
MTPARRQKLEAGLAIIREVNNADAWDTRSEAALNALIGMGAKLEEWSLTYTFRLGGVTASCTHDKGEHLLLRWAANARAKLEEGEG